MSKHVLITGGMGFIGHHLAKKYLQANFKVTIIDSLESHSSHAALTKYRMEYLDHKKLKFIHTECMNGIKITNQLDKSVPIRSVIHLASHPNQAAVEADRYNAASTMSTNTLMMSDLAKNYLNARMIYVSSSMAYGHFTKNPMTENEPLAPVNLYGLLKAQGEDIVKLNLPNHIIIRPSAVYGPGDNVNRVLGKWITAAMSGKDILVNNPNALLDFTHVDDLTNGIVAAETNGVAGETYNLTYGNARSLEEAADFIRQEVNSISQILIPEQPTRNEPIRGSLDISKARTQLGYNPKIDLYSGIRNYIDWMRRHSHVY
jgi:nucleoside-diphosphate-sugar epimerase